MSNISGGLRSSGCSRLLNSLCCNNNINNNNSCCYRCLATAAAALCGAAVEPPPPSPPSSPPSPAPSAGGVKGVRVAMAACRGLWTQQFWRSLLAEFLGSAFLVMLGAGATLTWSAQQPPSPVQVSLCFGLAVAAMAQCLGGVSGAHLNPAVTAALLVTRRVPLSRGVAFVAAQSLGATLGAALLLLVTPGDVAGALGATLVSARLQVSHAVLVEAIVTLQLVLTVCATTDDRRSDLKGSGSLAIGLSVALGHLFALPYTGSSMNPARSLGSAVVSGLWANHWVYWLGPMLGGVIGAATYEYLLYPTRRGKHHHHQQHHQQHPHQQDEEQTTAADTALADVVYDSSAAEATVKMPSPDQ